MYTTRFAPGGRGCGFRDEAAAYMCFGTGPGGSPVEEFVVDPALPWNWGFHRAPKILPRNPKDPDSVNDLIIWIGESNYASAWSFVEEARLFGVSRKMPPDLPYERLTPHESRMVFVHAKAIPLFDYKLARTMPLDGCKEFTTFTPQGVVDFMFLVGSGHHPNTVAYVPDEPYKWEQCTFALRDLSWLLHNHFPKNGQSDSKEFVISMPSFSFEGRYTIEPVPGYPNRLIWNPAIFMAFPISHIEFCRRANPDIQQRIEAAGFDTAILEW